MWLRDDLYMNLLATHIIIDECETRCIKFVAMAQKWFNYQKQKYLIDFKLAEKSQTFFLKERLLHSAIQWIYMN